MPELPEVETTRSGIVPFVALQTITQVIIRHHGLRWPIEPHISKKLTGQKVLAITRRGKYLLFQLSAGTIILHLGMSGRLSLLAKNTPAQKHDHVDLELSNGKVLRFTDPRRFGAFLWTNDPINHPLLHHLGVEPLTEKFSGCYLLQAAQNKKTPVKTFIMNQKTVVGVGNIYANEALFLSGIHPLISANKITKTQYDTLAHTIKMVLTQAIHQGGTTLKDFLNSEGKPGYFSQSLNVYGREHQPCLQCKTPLTAIQINKRATVFCPNCQKLT